MQNSLPRMISLGVQRTYYRVLWQSMSMYILGMQIRTLYIMVPHDSWLDDLTRRGGGRFIFTDIDMYIFFIIYILYEYMFTRNINWFHYHTSQSVFPLSSIFKPLRWSWIKEIHTLIDYTPVGLVDELSSKAKPLNRYPPGQVPITPSQSSSSR